MMSNIEIINICLTWHYARIRKGAGSRPDEVSAFFLINLTLSASLDPGIYSACNKIDYQIHKRRIWRV
jgi:hypothetical protein